MYFVPLTMLMFEMWSVINTRLARIALGGVDAMTESQLMVSEKLDAAFEAQSILAAGGNADHVVAHYRKLVAANAARLR